MGKKIQYEIFRHDMLLILAIYSGRHLKPHSRRHKKLKADVMRALYDLDINTSIPNVVIIGNDVGIPDITAEHREILCTVNPLLEEYFAYLDRRSDDTATTSDQPP